MDSEFKKTKAGVKICPFFGWQSENIEGLGRQEENDVSLTICCHEQNPHHHEGNCQKEWCPILKNVDKLIESPMLITLIEKFDNHLAEFERFTTTETYLFEARNIIVQLERIIEKYKNEPR